MTNAYVAGIDANAHHWEVSGNVLIASNNLSTNVEALSFYDLRQLTSAKIADYKDDDQALDVSSLPRIGGWGLQDYYCASETGLNSQGIKVHGSLVLLASGGSGCRSAVEILDLQSPTTPALALPSSVDVNTYSGRFGIKTLDRFIARKGIVTGGDDSIALLSMNDLLESTTSSPFATVQTGSDFGYVSDGKAFAIEGTYFYITGCDDRTITVSSGSPNKINLTGHGFRNGDHVYFQTTTAYLTGKTRYYVKNKADNNFEISATPSGSSITFTSDGSNKLIGAVRSYELVSSTLMPVGSVLVPGIEVCDASNYIMSLALHGRFLFVSAITAASGKAVYAYNVADPTHPHFVKYNSGGQPITTTGTDFGSGKIGDMVGRAGVLYVSHTDNYYETVSNVGIEALDLPSDYFESGNSYAFTQLAKYTVSKDDVADAYQIHVWGPKVYGAYGTDAYGRCWPNLDSLQYCTRGIGPSVPTTAQWGGTTVALSPFRSLIFGGSIIRGAGRLVYASDSFQTIHIFDVANISLAESSAIEEGSITSADPQFSPLDAVSFGPYLVIPTESGKIWVYDLEYD